MSSLTLPHEATRQWPCGMTSSHTWKNASGTREKSMARNNSELERALHKLAHSTSVRPPAAQSWGELHITGLENSTQEQVRIGLKKKGPTTFFSQLHSPVTPEPENLSRASCTPPQTLDRNIRSRTRRTRNTVLLFSAAPAPDYGTQESVSDTVAQARCKALFLQSRR